MFNITPQMLQAYMQMCQGTRRDPQQIIQQMLNSGQLSQEAYNNVYQLARSKYDEFQRMLTSYMPPGNRAGGRAN